MFQVAFWAFPQDINHIRAYANMTDNAVNWRRAIAMVKDDRVTDMCQVGKQLIYSQILWSSASHNLSSCRQTFNCWTSPFPSLVHVQGGPKRWHHFLHALSSSNINRFSKFFHCQNQEKICNNTITKDPTTPEVCRYTTSSPSLLTFNQRLKMHLFRRSYPNLTF